MQVPSATPKLVEMFLDMVSDNHRQQRLPHRDMFDDGHGQFRFYDRSTTVFAGTSRA
jgi:hypothetical protein